jgi:prolyl-tRNA synthetase
MVRRDTLKKIPVTLDKLRETLPGIFNEIQQALFADALRFQLENTHDASNYDEFKSIIETKRGFVKACWCGLSACEDKIKEETMATIRVIPLESEPPSPSGCIICGKGAQTLAYFARAY